MYKIAEESLVAEADKELYKLRGGFESDSSRAIREVKQFIITWSAYKTGIKDAKMGSNANPLQQVQECWLR